DAQDLGRRDRDLGGQLGTLAELQKRHLRAYRPIFGHVSSSLPHQPDRRDLRPFAATGFEKRAVPEWVDYLGLLLRWQRFGHVVLARRNKDSKSNRSHSIHLASWRRILRKIVAYNSLRRAKSGPVAQRWLRDPRVASVYRGWSDSMIARPSVLEQAREVKR